MSCSVAVCNSPVFSPSSSLFCSKTSIISQSPEALNLSLTHLKPSSSSPASPSPSSPSTPFRLWLQKPTSGSLLSTPSSSSAFFGVFDGHGGAKAAEFAAQKLEKNIVDEVLRRGDRSGVKEAVKDGYLKTDAEFLKEDVSGGTCCVTALIQNGNLIVSNAGDCRAVMSRGGVAEPLTSDHRPSREDEKSRIETSGGYVDLCRGVWRIQGSLAVSRGIGDQHLKQWVISEPETKIIGIKPECEFLILASDGLWDKVSNQEAVDIARPSCLGINKLNPLGACKKLVELSVSRGSSDDVSVMLVQLGRYL
ncbi:hypothetical protein Goari_012458 [Gossypium aridum]|uniref:protein-serine/threonine phosphatase n=1 Tax=Gossypium aridum TaxID=34290 RepID=A0A7J8X0I7_GOSAI|nr:hypothetical protein [Gossypium aridum]